MPEVRIEDEVLIHAPLSAVWQVIKNPDAQARWHPYIIRITGDHRLGAMRICSVVLGGKPGATQERCIEIEEDEQWRITWAIDNDTSGFSRRVSDWRAGFNLEHREGGTLVTAHSTFRPNNVLVWLMSPWIGFRFHHTQRTILKRLQNFVEIPEGR
ncbi:SRPBCC family protein [Streptomyces sp. NBC_00038]|uniref:SRPBCC family protein n=1 Tax=Streptomyces sp. NBC_00038 TaxID=2903615 RepID=UPI00225234EF|nr:SRPBCC family protein [Streptomyces sp. NBC_00038]MCX5559553.1 SRPBCC family protein [Streptomyces sp. NBC_00038]